MSIRAARVGGLLLASAWVASAAWAGVTWNDLVAKPELRPAQCTLKKGFEFTSGLSVKAGQKVNILEFNPDEIVLGSLDGKVAFGAQPSDTDVVEIASAAWDALTPKQRALGVDEVLARPELWPYKLTLKESFEVGRMRLNKGDSVYLMKVEKGELVVVPPTFDMHFELQPADTDLLEQARRYVETPPPGRLIEELHGKLVNAQTGQPMPLDANALPRYLVLYSGGRWCPYTQKFTPDLLKMYTELKPKYSNFEVIYLPQEKSPAELTQYAKELSFPWPAVEYRQKEKMAVLAGIMGRSSTPEIEVVDRYGNLLIDNYVHDREQVLVKFRELLEQTASK